MTKIAVGSDLQMMDTLLYKIGHFLAGVTFELVTIKILIGLPTGRY